MLKLLIIDDEEHVRLLLEEDLKEVLPGSEIFVLESGHDIIKKISSINPDIVILDIKMVDYDGLDVLQDIRKNFYNLPVILHTAYDSFKEDISAIAADYYVVKSFNLFELRKRIVMALTASGYREEDILAPPSDPDTFMIEHHLKQLINHLFSRGSLEYERESTSPAYWAYRIFLPKEKFDALLDEMLDCFYIEIEKARNLIAPFLKWGKHKTAIDEHWLKHI